MAHAPWKLIQPLDGRILMSAVVVAIALFGNGMSGGLVFDDHLAIEGNGDAAANGAPFWGIFHHDFWGNDLHSIASNRSFRPLVIMSFRLQHLLMGFRHHAPFLHLFNFTLAFANACFVYYLARLYSLPFIHAAEIAATTSNSLSHTEEVDHACLEGPLYLVPSLALFLFLLHPVHVEAVTSIVGRCELLCCLFGMIAFFCMHQYLRLSRPSDASLPNLSHPLPRSKGEWRCGQVIYLLVAVFALICTLLSKETGAVFCTLCALHVWWVSAHELCSKRAACTVVCVSVAVQGLYLSFRQHHLNGIDLGGSPLLRRTEHPQYYTHGLLSWLAVRWVIQMKNLELLFFPTSLCCEYSYNCIPTITSTLDLRLPVFTTMTVAVLLYSGTTIYRYVTHRSPSTLAPVLALAWIAIPYAPVSHLLVNVGTFIAERCLYIPSIGAVLVLVFSTYRVASPGAPPFRRGVLLLVCLGAFWAVQSYRRNAAWSDDESLFRASVSVCPTSGKAHYQLAAALAKKNRAITEEVAQLCRRSLELDEEFLEPLFFLGSYYWEKGDPQTGFALLRKCAGNPFTVSNCYHVFNEMRSYLMPDLKAYEIYLDNADVLFAKSQKAMMARQAGIHLLMGENKSCMAAATFSWSLQLWDESKLYWRNDNASPDLDDQHFCDSLRWYTHSFGECHYTTARSASAASLENRVPSSTGDEGAYRIQLEAVRLVRRSAALCHTRWHSEGFFTRRPRLEAQTYRIQMAQYGGIVSASLELVTRTLPTLSLTDHFAEGLSTAVELALRRYCFFSELVDVHRVGALIAATFPRELQAAREYFMEYRLEWLRDMLAAAANLRNLTSTSDVYVSPEMKELALCTGELSVIYHLN